MGRRGRTVPTRTAGATRAARLSLNEAARPAPAPAASRLRHAWALLHAAALLAGLALVYRPTLLGGGAVLQTDPGDTVLNHYILEHSWLWLTRANYAGSLWSPPCFYPEPLTLAYSENLLGTAPLYWLLRAVLSPLPAYAAWMILLSALSYASLGWVLRRLGVRHVLAAFGAFVFAFGLPRAAQLGHQQLLPHLFAPLALYAAWRFVDRPRLAALAGLLAACAWQVLASVYLGWFLHLALAVLLPWLLATHRDRLAGLAGFARRSWLPAAGLLAAWALVLGLLAGVYRQANADFERDWAECTHYVPQAADWLLPPPEALAARTGLSSQAANVERYCWPGWVVLGLAGLGLVLCVGRSRLIPPERSRLALALLGTALSLAVLALASPDGATPWRLVYDFVPGATAMRAVGRLGLSVLLFALAGGLLVFDAVLDALKRWPRYAAVAAVLLVGAVEQVPTSQPHFDAASWHARAEALGREMGRGTAVYVLPREEEGCSAELLAMWAGLHANRPVVNGYSGRLPDRYPDAGMPPGLVFGWLATHAPPGQLWPGQLLYVVPAAPGQDRHKAVLLEAAAPP